MPQFLVIAGPNGAGKSSFSSLFSRPGALIFDPDEHKLKIERQYPDIPQEAIESELTRRYFSGQRPAKLIESGYGALLS